MPRIKYEDWQPKPDARRVIRQAVDICSTYQDQGYDLTLRQLYYQFVARGLIENSQQSYKRLGDIVNKARLAGYLDWDYIVDRTRNLESLSHWGTPKDIMEAAARSFALDKWAEQPTRVEVWVEKEALAGVVSLVADRHDIAWFSCRGYVSQSELWGAARRHLAYIEGGQNVVVLHLGDHDPSGIDMTRDIRKRLHHFTDQDWLDAHVDEIEGRMEEGRKIVTIGAIRDSMRNHLDGRDPIEVRRIALNMDQVRQYDPPPNPAKLTDSRVAGYLDEYGTESWELDALEPQVLDALIEEHILAVRDDDLWEPVEEEEERHKRLLTEAAVRWNEVVETLEAS